jgi:hypothetical protein
MKGKKRLVEAHGLTDKEDGSRKKKNTDHIEWQIFGTETQIQ